MTLIQATPDLTQLVVPHDDIDLSTMAHLTNLQIVGLHDLDETTSLSELPRSLTSLKVDIVCENVALLQQLTHLTNLKAFEIDFDSPLALETVDLPQWMKNVMC